MSRLVIELREVRRTARKRLLDHPFFEILADDAEAPSAVRLWSMQDYYISRDFPRFVAMIAAHIPDPELRHAIVVNLWEEHGEGDFAKAHSRLFDLLLESIEINISTIDAPTPATENFIETQIKLTEDSVLAGLGAFCYGNEYLTLSEFRHIEHACFQAYPASNLAYFVANRQADGRHGREAERVILQLCTSEDEINQVKHGAEAAVDARLSFYDDLCKKLASD
jgi:pyrroloquinoline-quinone synthase